MIHTHPSGRLNVSQQPVFPHTTERQKDVGIIFDDSKLSQHPQLLTSFGVVQSVSFTNLLDERKSIIEWKTMAEGAVYKYLRSKTHEDTLDASVCQFCRSLLLSHLRLNQSRIFAMTLTGHSTTELDGFEPSHLACRTGCGKRNSHKGWSSRDLWQYCCSKEASQHHDNKAFPSKAVALLTKHK